MILFMIIKMVDFIVNFELTIFIVTKALIVLTYKSFVLPSL